MGTERPVHPSGDPLLQWEEPVYFLSRKHHAHTAAERVSRSEIRPRWFENVWGAPPFRVAGALGATVLFVGAFLVIVSGNYSLASIASAVGAGLIILMMRSYRVWSVSLRGPDFPVTTVVVGSEAVELRVASEPDVRWAYADIQRAKVGAVHYEEGQRSVLQLKAKGEGWHEINVAEDVPLDELAEVLRERGIPVRERVKRWWYE